MTRRWCRLVAAAFAALGLVAVLHRRTLRTSRRSRVTVATSAIPAGTGRARRGAELAAIGARTTASYTAMTARSVLADDQRKQELRSEFELRTAADVVATLGQMKGAMMKLGQMASYLDQGLPEPVRAMLSQLQADAPPMAWELVE